MVTTREAIETMKEDYGASGASSSGHIETDDDAYEDLRNANARRIIGSRDVVLPTGEYHASGRGRENNLIPVPWLGLGAARRLGAGSTDVAAGEQEGTGAMKRELEIFDILTDYDEFTTLREQKEFCKRVAALFPPHHLTLYALQSIVAQLRLCGYECEGGPLESNTAFIALCELAEIRG